MSTDHTQQLQESPAEAFSPQQGSAFWHAYNDAMPAMTKGLAAGLAIEVLPPLLEIAGGIMKLPESWRENISKIQPMNPLAPLTFSTTTIITSVCFASVFIPNYNRYKAEEEALQNANEAPTTRIDSSFAQHELDKKRSNGFAPIAPERG